MKEQKRARARQIHSSRGKAESCALNICFLLRNKAQVVFGQTARSGVDGKASRLTACCGEFRVSFWAVAVFSRKRAYTDVDV